MQTTKKQLGTSKPSSSLLESKIRKIVRQQLNEGMDYNDWYKEKNSIIKQLHSIDEIFQEFYNIAEDSKILKIKSVKVGLIDETGNYRFNGIIYFEKTLTPEYIKKLNSNFIKRVEARKFRVDLTKNYAQLEQF